MHHWDSVHETGIAPYPVIPTYRPDPPLMKRKNPSMPTPLAASPTSTRSAPRPQARSAGMAERPSRNENLSDLVRFFQTQSMPADTTTALPAVESPNRDQQQQQQPPPQQQQQQQQLKPFHRRLLQFTQRQKKDPSAKPKVDDNQKQIEALQREGYLLAPPPPKQKGPKGSLDSSKASLDRSLSSSKKKDVETIGQPWLEDKTGSTDHSGNRRRLSSLDLDDFGSMVDVAVSMSEFDDSVPPPYQARSSAGASQRDQNANSRLTAARTLASSSSEGRSSSFDRPMSPTSSTVDVQHSVSRVDFASRRSSTSNSSLRIVDPDTNPPAKSKKNAPGGVHTLDSSNQSTKSDPKPEQTSAPPSQTPDCPPPHPPTAPTQPSLKLFPDVAPPRMSSKNAWRLSAVPRYQTAPTANTSTTSAQPETSGPVKSSNSKKPLSESAPVEGPKEGADPACRGAQHTTAVSAEIATAEIAPTSPAASTPKKSRPPSFALGTLKAFPLPAPTKPLPSVPKTGNAPTAPADGKPNATLRPVRSGLMVPSFHSSQPSPIAEDPREPGPRAATAMGFIAAGEADGDDPRSLETTPERPKSTSPEQHTPKRRQSVRVSRMHGLPESPPGGSEQSAEGHPVADSPVLGQMTPTKPNGRRAASKGLHINPQSERNVLPFGLPSPPPTASLPSDPPAYPPPECPLPYRNFTTPAGSGAPPTKGLEMTFGPGLHRGSLISRSNSSRSSLRHESIPESYEPSRPESPLPSSDEEGFAPVIGHSRKRRTADKRSHLPNPGRRGYDTLDIRPGHSRPRLSQSMRPLTPQSRSCHNLDKTASPQSQYSQSTYRSRDSASHHRVPRPPNHASQLLEDRVANLERQNQILQAALMAALNAGSKNNMDDMSGSMSPASSAAGLANPYQSRFMSRPESWVSSSRSSDNSGFETSASLRDSRATARHLDHMLEDIEAGWLSDKSSLSGARSMARHR
ncbi:hypothetical protein N7492_003221 [Penicillium capsulatum]|uniref:Uncharacterized protein n=1 Tax=Penicillium capsulatum TaxID=69766 RepID=A0A9W9LVX0_9EURO|nr:hypothetical protein N7492_003221 [Penicillium capsulatum]KAJ6122192.1 hypothetical protein N7512_004657 [Penicillium capsulatum]